MDTSRFFIENPRFSGVIAVVMVLVGLIALVVLPISQYPQITPPQIVVTATYPGAGATVLSDTVAVPIENALNGIDGVLYMSSTSSDDGTYQLTVTFNIGVDPDMAQVKVENRLQQAKSLLPDIVNQEGVDVKTQSANILGFLVLESPQNTFTGLELSNFAYTTLKGPLGRVAGVGDVTIYGPQNSMRIWLDPLKLAALNLSAADIVQAIESQNTQAALGSIGAAPVTGDNNLVIGLTTKGLLNSVTDFENITVAVSADGGIVRLKDVARVELGANNYDLNASYNNRPSVIIALSQTPGSNALTTMKNLHSEIDVLQQSFPEDMVLKTAYDSTDFVRASIRGIISTLIITFLLVIGVVFMFLQNFKATLIPMITIPVSLIATFMVIYVIGFDINILTLFALVLAIGLVVDDAIIVVERVQYLMTYRGMDSTSAAIQAMRDISSSIIATTLVLLSIFVPVGLMAGITGEIYKQFAITIATAVLFSAVNALTLSPALCAIFLNSKEKRKKTALKKNGFYYFNIFLNGFQKIYLNIVSWLASHLKKTVLLLAGAMTIVVFLFIRIPQSFIPEEDQGVLFASVQLSDTAGIQQTESVLRNLATPILAERGVAYFMGIAGASLLGGSGENIGMAVIGLKPWDERKGASMTASAIEERLRARYSDNPLASVNFFALPAIPGVGNSDGLSFQLNAVTASASTTALGEALDKLLIQMNRNQKVFSYGFSTFVAGTPHLYLDINRDKLAAYNITVGAFFETLQNYIGSRYVNNITLDGQINQVMIQADFPARADMDDVMNLYVPTQNGTLVQVKNFATTQTVMMPSSINRFNQYLTAAVTAAAAEGVSTGTAIDAVQTIADTLGKGFRVAWTGLSLQEVETEGLALILITLAIVFSYLFLVALYESWLIAFSVIFTNVFAVLGALIGLTMMGLPLSIYAQLGIVLLIGLASKNAILIVQFTSAYHRQGLSILQAAVKGAGERFRAVLMTALTFILGVMPMIFATGAGAGSQVSMGTSVFFGMISATVIGILFVPALFALFTAASDHFAPVKTTDSKKRRKKDEG